MVTRIESPTPTPPSESGPGTCALYIPGHKVHFIQARLSQENPEQNVPGLIESIAGQIVRVRVGEEVRSYRNHDLSRLIELSVDTREVVLRQRGVLECRSHLVCIAPADEPWTSCRGPSTHGTDAASLGDRLLNDGGFLISATDLAG
jgi:hypothetical protein